MENEPVEKLNVAEFNALVERLIVMHYDVKAGLSLEDAAEITGLEVQEVKEMLVTIRAEAKPVIPALTPPTFADDLTSSQKPPMVVPYSTSHPINRGDLDFDLKASGAGDFKPISDPIRPVLIALAIVLVLFCLITISMNNAKRRTHRLFEYYEVIQPLSLERR